MLPMNECLAVFGNSSRSLKRLQEPLWYWVVSGVRVCVRKFSAPTPLCSEAERTLSPHDMNRQGLPLPSTPFNHRSVSLA